MFFYYALHSKYPTKTFQWNPTEPQTKIHSLVHGRVQCLVAIYIASLSFAGPPERLEIVTLTTKLTGTVGREWKLLAAPLSISDADVNSIDYEERTLKLKINKLLTLWVDKDEGNDRTILSQLLGSLDGYNLEHDCQMSLKTL